MDSTRSKSEIGFDIMPTILEASGIKQPGARFAGRPVQPIQGNSVLPLLDGRETETAPGGAH